MTALNRTLTVFAQPKQTTFTPEVDLLLVSKAGFWIRTVAYLLDQLLVALLTIFLWLSALVILNYAGILEIDRGMLDISITEGLGYLLAIVYGAYVLHGIYCTFFHGYSGQTVGKMIMNLRVVTTVGENLSYWRSFKRWLGYFASSIIFYIGYLMVAFTKDKQGLHDKIAGTYVVRL